MTRWILMLSKFFRSPVAIPMSIIGSFALYFKYPVLSQALIPYGDLYISLFLLSIIPVLSISIIIAVQDLVIAGKSSINTSKWIMTYLFMYLFVVGIAISIVNLFDLSSSLRENSTINELISSSKSFEIKEVTLYQPLVSEKAEGIGEFLVKSVPNNIFEALSTGHMIQIIIFSILFGIALGAVNKESRETVVNALGSFLEPFIQFIDWAVAAIPIGIFLIFSKYAGNLKDPAALIYLWKFIGVSLLGLVILICMCIWFVSLRLKISFASSFRVIQKPAIIALATADSLSTLPTLMQSVVSRKILKEDHVKFLLPLGVSLFEFGAIFYFAMIAEFMIKLYGIDMTASSYVILIIGVYFAAASETIVPLGSLSLLFAPLGIPVVFVTTFLVIVDWIIDPFRTLLGVSMNYAGTVFIASPHERRKKS